MRRPELGCVVTGHALAIICLALALGILLTGCIIEYDMPPEQRVVQCRLQGGVVVHTYSSSGALKSVSCAEAAPRRMP